jgi:hypothetical protein
MSVSTGEGTISVDFDTLKRLVKEAGLGIPESAEVVFGNAHMTDGGELEFSYAFDDADCHPSEWADAPEWLRKSR